MQRSLVELPTKQLPEKSPRLLHMPLEARPLGGMPLAPQNPEKLRPNIPNASMNTPHLINQYRCTHLWSTQNAL
jgi:hypothetical protein